MPMPGLKYFGTMACVSLVSTGEDITGALPLLIHPRHAQALGAPGQGHLQLQVITHTGSYTGLALYRVLHTLGFGFYVGRGREVHSIAGCAMARHGI